ncbi:MAG: MBOAT family O-acyltransferase [Treponema sp.]
MRPAGSVAEVFLYISFFPQLASGPIVQAEPFFRTLPESLNRDSDPSSRPIAFDKSLVLIISGTYKKMILANFLLVLAVDPVFAHPAQCNTVELLIALLAYTFVIYCDFSGYSDMAIGIALLLGFETPQNFNRPYMVQSVTEFWRCWHISFSSWLRNYVYFAFGGSRFGLIRTAMALIATMVIAGIWHGGRITFLLWGGLQGLACALERIGVAITQHKNTDTVASKSVRISFLRMSLVFLFINTSWLIFRSTSLQELKLYIYSLQNMATPFNTVHPFAFVLLALAFLLQLPNEAIRTKMFTFYVQLPAIVKISAAALFFIILYTVSMSGTAPFIYFGF